MSRNHKDSPKNLKYIVELGGQIKKKRREVSWSGREREVKKGRMHE